MAGVSSSANGTEAMLWTPANGMVGLGDLPNGAFTSEAIGISADGSLIVGYGTTDLGEEAVLWDESLTIHRVVDYLATQGVQVPAGWLLQRAYDITMNCCATTIVGYGLNPNGDPEAWMAKYTPDSPPTTCNDGDACTINDTCSAGSCTGTPMDCTSLDDVCNVGVCSSSQCQAMPANNGGACDDDNSCTTNDVCASGDCTGTPPPPWGDITPFDCDPVVSGCNVVNIDDILCVLASFAGNYACAGGLANADIVPCTGNGVINLDDILGVLNAFTGANQCPCVP